MADAARVGVIGAGGSGIVAGVALARAGLDFEILEGRSGIGGTWLYDPGDGGSACYASLVANTSKLRMSLRSGRIPGRPWQYAHHTEMREYLEGMAERYGLRDRIRLGWRVAAAARHENGWVLRSPTGEARHYDALVCALGVNGRPRWATFDGEFTGEQLHSAAYRAPERFAGQDVLVIGLGTSGCEVAGEAAGHARSVTVAVRSAMWLMTRRLAGMPIDWLDNPHVDRVVPWRWRRMAIAGLCEATTGRLRRLGVPEPERRCGDDIIAISDSFPRALRRGLVNIRPAVQSVHGSEVRFEDGSAMNADVIVHATGFDLPTDFLPSTARPDAALLYRGIVHADEPRLHFIGLIEAHRALLPIVEAQAAWSADVLAGRIHLPDTATMASAARADAHARAHDFGTRHPYLVDHARYMATLRRDRRRVTSSPGGYAASMDPIIVRRHAGRWSVQVDPETAPQEEYETRELAEVAARGLAEESGRSVVVHDGSDGPEDREDRSDQAPADRSAPTGAETEIDVPGAETPREPQAGL